ncbi:hypothetical protein QWY28_00390 [Nocardioides sp. SOB77]|uniref:DUF559 domain-containing protein n=1 Tax=Nocardioides oceani TaxID=3058369 RepID=A0ABT8F9M6_9ACTN|nr:hypothetical protein [Nocardioides oceani]MDN4171393.1 hypothetical protein [Nocardioides oceani]
MPDVVDLLADLGGVARRGVLLGVVERGDLERALAAGTVTRAGRGLYALPGVDDALRVAADLGGVVSHASAALQHGFRGGDPRPVPADAAMDEALAIADSALRESACRRLLEELAETARGPGSPRIRQVAALATELAANPFESVLRATCLDVPGLAVRPQVRITDDGFSARADLVDERLRIVCEADSFAWHGSRSALASDARRYNRMVVAGWIVVRFTYEDVMFHPDEVRAVLARAVALAEVLVDVRPGGGAAA